MKSSSFFLIALMSLITLSCTDDITNMGSQIQPEGDKIIVDTASVVLSSENYVVPYMYSKPDSLILGTFVDNTYGTLYADILTQVQPPLDFSYPEGAVADSAKIIMYYYAWFGDSYSPMEVNIYEMNKGKTFNYSGVYKSDINIDEYTDKTVKIGSRIFTAKDAVVIRPDTTTIEFPLSKSFVERFSPVLKKRYNDDPKDTQNYVNKFHEFFNGMYITTDFYGSASLLYLRGIVLRYYFSYKYLAAGAKDSTTVNAYVNYPANREVRQVNRFLHPNVNTIKQSFDAKPEINVISSPANIYTKISVPFGNLKSKMKVGNKKPLINRAVLRVDATEIDDSDLAKPLASSLLLIKESAYESFFKNRELPADTSAILASISYEEDDEDEDNILYYYSFDLAKFITNELKNTSGSNNNINFYLVPVSLQYDGNSNVIQVKQTNLPSAVKICSGTHPKRPMTLKMVYSGF